MSTMTITDLPGSRALDEKALSAIRGAGAGDWCLYAFRPFVPDSSGIVPMIVYETNYIADQMTLQNQNIVVDNSGAGATITVNAVQNALNVKLAPIVTLHT
jgi:hypothetical protein